MEVRFANYRFLSEGLMLYRENELIPLKRNQAVLLQFFLLEPEAIHSKDAIMDSVWQGRVVSEQVVFQTISQLRALLGDNAIQTFSKKGYKWQIPLNPITENPSTESDEITVNHLESANPPVDVFSVNKNVKGKKKFYTVVIFSLALLVLILTFLLSRKEVLADRFSIFIPISGEKEHQSIADFNRKLISTLSDDATFNIQGIELTGSIKQFFSAPKHKWQQATLNAQDWLVSGEILSSENGSFYHYVLTNEKLTWQGYVYSEELKGLENKFISRLHELEALGVFSALSTQMDFAVLSSIHKQVPNDPEVTLLLAKYYIAANQTDIALTYLDKLTKQNSAYAYRPYQAQAYYNMGKIYKHSGYYELAYNNFDQMDLVLTDTPLLHLRLDIVSANAWLAYAQGDSKKMFTILAEGLSLLEKTNDPLALFELHILHSILAEKTGNPDKKYDHLNEAQALLLQHDLDESNLAIIYYHFALFSQDNDKATPYLKRILALPRTANNYWVQDQAFELYLQNYIEEKSFSLAHLLFEKELTSPVKMVLKAKVYQAQHQNELALPLFKKAFELARLEHDIYTGLRAALGLYQITKNEPDIQAVYWAYLAENAEKSWLKQHNVMTAQE